MTSYSNVFGGPNVQPATVSYATYTAAANIKLNWATSYIDNNNPVAQTMDIDLTVPDLVVIMPDATEVSVGQSSLINNRGANDFAVYDFGATPIVTIAVGESYLICLTDNSTEDGTYTVIQIGAVPSAPQPSALAGLGLVSLNNVLNTNIPGKILNVDYQVLTSDRASMIVWTGGAGTITMPNQIDGFYLSFNNEGSGAVTLATPDATTIDGAATFAINPNESLSIIGVATNWNTLGYGVETFFQVNVLSPLDISGAATTILTNQQTSRLVQKFTGALVQNVTVEYPAAAGQWYVWNATTNAFSVTLKLNGIGAGVVIPQGEKLIIYSDGAEMYNTPTVSTSAVFSDGNAGTPGIAFTAQTSTGFFRPSSGTVGYSSAGTQTITFASYGLGIITGGASRYYNAANTQYVGFRAGVLAANTIWVLPVADATVSGQLLKSDAATNLSFTSAAYPNATTINQILYSSAANTITGLATANNGVLITSAGGVPSISSTIPNATQDNITRLGTIVSGVWNGTVLTVPFGGTGLATLTTAYGVVCAGTTATGVLQNAGAGTAAQVFTSNGAAALPTWQSINVALPSSSKADQIAGVSTGVYTDPSTQQFHNSACKAWIIFDGSIAGAGGVLASYNCTKNRTAVGAYTLSFTVPFTTANYSFNAVGGISVGVGAILTRIPDNTPPLAGSITVATYSFSSGLNFDSSYVCAQFYGTQ
jgi:hypothetical protein